MATDVEDSEHKVSYVMYACEYKRKQAPKMLEISLIRVRTVLRLEGGEWSMVSWLRRSTNEDDSLPSNTDDTTHPSDLDTTPRRGGVEICSTRVGMSFDATTLVAEKFPYNTDGSTPLQLSLIHI